MSAEEYPDLGYGDSDDDGPARTSVPEPVEVNNVKLVKPLLDADVAVGWSSNFSASPTIIHFGGLNAGVEHAQILSIINRNSKSQRFLIIPPSTSVYRLEYEKLGHIAPGMSQKVTVYFKPAEYKYYYDSIRVRGEDQTLLIPLHGYPLLNEVNFPKTFSFGNVPLCEISVKVSYFY